MPVTSGPDAGGAPRPARQRLVRWVAAACGVLALVNALLVALPAGWDSVAALVGAAGVLTLGRRQGLSWQQMGLGPGTWRSGLRWGVGAAALVLAFYAVTIALPLTRDTTNDLAAPTGENVWVTALLLIPLRTILFEELLFRGVLWGWFERQWDTRSATVGTALAFGCWHVAPALSLASRTNSPTWSGIVGAVAFTSVAGLVLGDLRRRSRSVLAPAALHWAANGLGLVAAYLA